MKALYIFLGSIMALAIFFMGGCTIAQVDVSVVGERTALENQILGTYNALDQDMLMLASARSVNAEGEILPAPNQSREFKDAVFAMQTLAFYQDDAAAFKALGWAGEGNDGLLKIIGFNKVKAPSFLKDFAQTVSEKEFENVINQINTSRMTVMQRVIQVNENLSSADLPRVRRIFADLNRKEALAGEKVQNSDGSWTDKP